MNIAALVRYHNRHRHLPTDAAASVTPHVDRVCYEWQKHPVKLRRVLKAFVRSRRNQPPTPVWSEWICDECGKAGQTVQGPSGCFRTLYCYGCGRRTEHAGVLPS